ncbi:GIY-YIG nuclease family protein [Hymenobacter latericus]|uniref:GIY-YIG nuclease family protein n=1 Tax=Hymenobacter sp. YIM 151858-1 TaxID=2987688 RepID=UPI002226A178|nr:GIY-YIG nuclease family protein [Hymenobacter sp. YIM 151858-1]UYZ60073.1 GIY-YIG nuclease family protein [Hymenobacter sp. YIM 151858-1]
MVYCIGSREHKVCKIGYSNNPEDRMKKLQCGFPFQLEVLAEKEGGQKEEALLHQRFAEDRLNGEWFTLTAEIAAYFGFMGESMFRVAPGAFERISSLSPTALTVYALATTGRKDDVVILDTAKLNDIATRSGLRLSVVEQAIDECIDEKVLVPESMSKLSADQQKEGMGLYVASIHFECQTYEFSDPVQVHIMEPLVCRSRRAAIELAKRVTLKPYKCKLKGDCEWWQAGLQVIPVTKDQLKDWLRQVSH